MPSVSEKLREIGDFLEHFVDGRTKATGRELRALATEIEAIAESIRDPGLLPPSQACLEMWAAALAPKPEEPRP